MEGNGSSVVSMGRLQVIAVGHTSAESGLQGLHISLLIRPYDDPRQLLASHLAEHFCSKRAGCPCQVREGLRRRPKNRL